MTMEQLLEAEQRRVDQKDEKDSPLLVDRKSPQRIDRLILALQVR
jgi:hypothetical protein